MKRYSTKDSVIVLLIIVVLCIVLYPYIDSLIGGQDTPSKVNQLINAQRKAERKKQDQYYAQPIEKSELFAFDPNTADSTQLLRLGLRPWQVRNIYKFRAKGGRYRQPSDFARLYGLTAEKYRQLEPYINIKGEIMAADVYGTRPSSYTSNSQYYTQNNPSTSTVEHRNRNIDSTLLRNYPIKLKAGETININTADTSELKRIPGIGSYYAKQIVYRRQQLGGIYSPQQLLEIEDFPETALSFMTVGQRASSSSMLPKGVNSIKINHTNARQLARHPYIKYVQAKQIEEYRTQRGFLRSVDDLYRIPSFTQQEIQRLAPYIDFE